MVSNVLSVLLCFVLFFSSQFGYEGRVPLKSARLFYDISEKARKIVESYFMLNSTLYFSYTHMVCRTALSGRFPDPELVSFFPECPRKENSPQQSSVMFCSDNVWERQTSKTIGTYFFLFFPFWLLLDVHSVNFLSSNPFLIIARTCGEKNAFLFCVSVTQMAGKYSYVCKQRVEVQTMRGSLKSILRGKHPLLLITVIFWFSLPLIRMGVGRNLC